VRVKAVLITGASTGIGQACALHLDHLGHRVYAGVRTEAQARELRASGSGRIAPLILDVTDQAMVDAAAAQIARDIGKLNGIVNNAGIAKGGPLEYISLATWREQFEVNVLGQVAVTKAMLPLIRPARGRVVFMGSISGKVATMLLGPYCASKLALEAIGESLQHELRRRTRTVLTPPQDPVSGGSRRQDPKCYGPVASRPGP
jgi:NAD(P)-dependent dehydrogenase (short-subunit alcohol dehydrogenase family)